MINRLLYAFGFVVITASFGVVLSLGQDDTRCPNRYDSFVEPSYVYHQLAHRTDLGKNASATRNLSLQELHDLLAMSDYLLERRNPNRHDAAEAIGRLGHAWGLSALAAVLHDETDDRDVRRRCVRALFGIADHRVVDIAISRLHDSDLNVWIEVAYLLKSVEGPNGNPRPKIIDFPKTHAERLAYQKVWRDWWGLEEESRKATKIKRFPELNPYIGGVPSPLPSHGE